MLYGDRRCKKFTVCNMWVIDRSKLAHFPRNATLANMKTFLIAALITLQSFISINNCLAQGLPQVKTEVEEWYETQTSFEQLLYGEINNQTCSKSLKLFIACMEAINRALELSYPENRYLTQLDNAFAPNLVSSLPGFLVRAYKKNDPSLKDYENSYYSVLKNDYQNWISFKFVLRSINFTNSLKLIKQRIKNINHEAFIAAKIYNSYLANSMDPHTRISPKTVNDNRIKSSEDVKIFGFVAKPMQIEDQERFVIAQLLKGSPAMLSGKLETGDIVLEVDSKTITKEVFTAIGKKETITLKVNGTKGLRTVKLTRDVVTLDNVEVSVVKDSNNQKYGHIVLKSYMDKNACVLLELAGQNLISSHRIKGTILDLRDNTGGLVATSNCLLNLYLENNSYVFIAKDLKLSGRSSVSAIASNGRALFNKMHNVVLINGYSASASEATSLFLQAYRKAFVVGEQSFGKGTMQISEPLVKNDKIAKIHTIARFYGPHHISPQIQGVIPDFNVYPNYGQKNPTPYLRERDRYKNLIPNKTLEVPIMSERIEQIKKIKHCITTNNLIKNDHEALNYFKKLVFDQQLSAAKAVLNCAVSLELPVFQETKIPIAPESDLLD
jgi:C-terminal peptidase prc